MMKSYYIIAIEQFKKYWLIALFVILYMAIMEIFSDKLGVCLIKNITGYPCPTCGMTRAYIALFNLDIAKAFYYHPLFFLIPILGFILIFGERPKISIFAKSKLFWISVSGLFIIVYIIRMILVFPNEPLDYQHINLSTFIRSFISSLF